jgi:hypothetical protein
MLDFPSSPSTGQKYPAPPIDGVPVYTWDGEKWVVAGPDIVAAPGSNVNPKMDGVAAPGIAIPYSREDHVHPIDTSRLAVGGGQTLTGGFNFTPVGLTAGNLTINALLGNYQYVSNNAAFSITAPAKDSAVDILVTNTATAGAITFVGFVVGTNTGDLLTTTNGHIFILSIRRINAISTYVIKALQ